jgi:hypothetical protein
MNHRLPSEPVARPLGVEAAVGIRYSVIYAPGRDLTDPVACGFGKPEVTIGAPERNHRAIQFQSLSPELLNEMV